MILLQQQRLGKPRVLLQPGSIAPTGMRQGQQQRAKGAPVANSVCQAFAPPRAQMPALCILTDHQGQANLWHLRQHLRDSDVRIETLRGVGYKLTADPSPNGNA